MKKLKTRHFLFILCLLAVFNVQAAIITQTDAGSSGANLQAMEWLSLDVTRNISRNQIEAGYGGYFSNGWRYATGDETEILLKSIYGNINCNGLQT